MTYGPPAINATDPLRLVGQTLDERYAIDSLVRVDAGSIVYRATDLATKRALGVRVLTSLGAVSEARRAALHESLVRDHAKLAELAAILPAAHPMLDVGTVEMPGGAWISFVVLAWPHGLTLRQALELRDAEQRRESVEQVVSGLEPIAVALAIAHEHGVVHGDVTAERVLFLEDARDRDPRPVLLDFGVARVLRVAEGAGDATPADDVRALAELLGRALGDTRRGGAAEASDTVEGVLACAQATDTFASVGDFWSALRHAMGLVPLRALEATIPPEAGPEPSTPSHSLRPTARSTPPPPPPGSPSRARRLVATIASGAVVAALGVATVLHAGARLAPGSDAARAAAPATCPDGMVRVGPSTFTMGGDADDPARAVALHAFCVDRDAVSAAAYWACSDRGDGKRASRSIAWDGVTDADHEALDALCVARDPDAARSARPVNCVTWEMAAAYCAERGARLPTEAEWEAGARAGLGASVAEWVADWRGASGADVAANGPQVDPRGPARGDERVVRGAHAAGGPSERFGASPATRSHAIGFRCVF